MSDETPPCTEPDCNDPGCLRDRLHRAEDEMASARAEAGDRDWQHATCLSIAEGAPGWGQDFGDRASPAMLAVQKLRRERDALRVWVEKDGPCAYCGEEPSSVAGSPARWPLRFVDGPFQEGASRSHHVGCVVARLRERDALRAAAREAIIADDVLASVEEYEDWPEPDPESNHGIVREKRDEAFAALRRLLDGGTP